MHRILLLALEKITQRSVQCMQSGEGHGACLAAFNQAQAVAVAAAAKVQSPPGGGGKLES